MTETFTWRAEVESTGDGMFAATKVQFGEGLSQSYSEGINNDVQKWSVKVSGKKNYVAPILAFVRAHKGVSSFFWTPPLGEVGLYQVVKYGISDQGGAYFTLTLDFEQVFAPQ